MIRANRLEWRSLRMDPLMGLRSLTDIRTQLRPKSRHRSDSTSKIKSDQAADLAGCMDTFVSGMANQKTRSAIAAIAARVTNPAR